MNTPLEHALALCAILGIDGGEIQDEGLPSCGRTRVSLIAEALELAALNERSRWALRASSLRLDPETAAVLRRACKDGGGYSPTIRDAALQLDAAIAFTRELSGSVREVHADEVSFQCVQCGAVNPNVRVVLFEHGVEQSRKGSYCASCNGSNFRLLA